MLNITPDAFFSGLTAIADLLDNNAGVDTVGIFDATTLNQLFFNARPIKAEIRESSIIMRHPVESGTIIADNHIINQVEINILLFISSENYNSVYTQLKQAFTAATSLIVQTRTGVYPNMIIADMPHIEDIDPYNAVTLSLHLIEVIYILPTAVTSSTAPANFSPSNAANTSTIQAGLKYGMPASNSNTSAVQSILTGIGFKALGKL